jgi:hypothetical protein
VLDNIHANDWAMYAGVEFGGEDYHRTPDSLKVNAASATTGGTVEVWLDSLDTGVKVAECTVGVTGSTKTFQTFASSVQPVSGRHDVYFKFMGTGTGKLFLLQSFVFTAKSDTTTAVGEVGAPIPQRYTMEQNYPNPFNPSTEIRFSLPKDSQIKLSVFDLLGRKAAVLAEGRHAPGAHTVRWNADNEPAGLYFCRLEADGIQMTRKMMLLK